MVTVLIERVDDIPLLLEQLERMGVGGLLDDHFPTHGHWGGWSLGRVTAVWLTHLLSQGDHRLSWVQSWVAKHLETLTGCLGQGVRELDFSDDRLSAILRQLSDDARWEAFEAALNRQLLRVYDLDGKVMRLDSTSAKGYWTVTEEGLFQLGHSKDHRPDLPQVKVKLATLDPLGLPVVTQVVAGNRADDPLYIPAIEQVREGLGERGLLYVGDCKMGAVETRAWIHQGGDFYLCPLAQKQCPQEQLERYLAPVWTGDQVLSPVYRDQEDGSREQIAEGFEVAETVTTEVQGQVVTWTERRLIVRSLKQAETQEKALRKRVAQAQAEIAALNVRRQGKKHYPAIEPLREAAEAIAARYRVASLLRLHYEQNEHQRQVRRWRDRPERVVVEREAHVTVQLHDAAVDQAVRALGWRVYATNQTRERLPLEQGILGYRGEYLVERGFNRLKNVPLSLTPMYLQREDHVTGLIRLLSLGLRVLTLVEFEVRRKLAEEQAVLRGLYPGNPKRATARPTTERLLGAFQEIHLTIWQEASQTRRHITPLSSLQQRILALLGFPETLYTRLGVDLSNPP